VPVEIPMTASAERYAATRTLRRNGRTSAGCCASAFAWSMFETTIVATGKRPRALAATAAMLAERESGRHDRSRAAPFRQGMRDQRPADRHDLHAGRHLPEKRPLGAHRQQRDVVATPHECPGEREGPALRTSAGEPGEEQSQVHRLQAYHATSPDAAGARRDIAHRTCTNTQSR
jgi:hypothetical protein